MSIATELAILESELRSITTEDSNFIKVLKIKSRLTEASAGRLYKAMKYHPVTVSEAAVILLKENDPIQKRMDLEGLPIAIEWPKGSTRIYQNSGYKREMLADYGYVEDAVSEYDGDCIDVYVGESPNTAVYVVTQLKLSNESGEREFDEFKYMLNFASRDDAEKTYKAQMSDDHFGGIFTMTLDELKQMVAGMKQ